jgi:hypothetical protein
MSCRVARYKVTFDMPLRLAAGERAMAIAGRLQDRLQATRARGVTSPEVATYRIRRGRLRGVTVAMIIQAADAARALAIAMEALREAMGTDSRSWDVAGTGATVVPVLAVAPTASRRLVGTPSPRALAAGRRGCLVDAARVPVAAGSRPTGGTA